MTRKRPLVAGLLILFALLFVGSSVLANPYGSRTLYSGTIGGDVAELQRRLNSLGYSAGSADGIFGARTREAVVSFQRDYGLVPDGMASKWTFRAVDRAFTWQHGSFYTIAPGDSLWLIAQASGTKVESITWLNQLQDTMIYPGQVLRLPGEGLPAAPPVAVTPPPPAPEIPAPTPVQPPPTPPAPSQEPAPAETPLPDPVVPVPPEPAAPPAPPPAQQRLVLGYYAEDWQTDVRALNSLKSAAGKVDLVVNFALFITAQGEIETRSYPGLMAEARAQGIPVQGLVHNFVGSTFDPNIARAVLSNPEIRARAVQNMLKVAREHGLQGINIDIENVPPDQRDNYTALIRELSAVMKPEGLELTLSIPAKTWDDPRNGWSGAFDYAALGKYADRIAPMTYDEHTPGYTAGPVASLGWVENVIKFATSQIPSEKVLMGVATYAYDWKRGTTEGRGLSIPQTMDLALRHGAVIQWDEKAQVPFFTYVNNGVERIVYYENARSLAPKLDLVEQYNLGGIAIWRLGLEDPGIWSVIGDRLR